MALKEPKNRNYCANVVELTNIRELEGCDNVAATNIFGNTVIVGKSSKVGDIGIFFPSEVELSDELCMNNNLYRDSSKNMDKGAKGYIENNRRIKTMKFRGHRSEGLFLPLSCVDYAKYRGTLSVGSSFDELDGKVICGKYVVPVKNTAPTPKSEKKPKKSLGIVDGQFRFHIDTDHLGKNISHVKEEDVIQITRKEHGTSMISSRLLCQKKLSLVDKIAKVLGANVVDTEYRNIYSSRRVIKNPNVEDSGYYSEDIWGVAHKELEPYLLDGMTIYCEITGYTSDGAYLQKGYDYGCTKGSHRIAIYRITLTNTQGIVYEFSPAQVQEWASHRGLNAVEQLYYGGAGELYSYLVGKYESDIREYDPDNFLDLLSKEFLEKNLDSNISKKVPDEGIVLRRETLGLDVYKHKSFAFKMYESKQLDSGEADIEETN